MIALFLTSLALMLVAHALADYRLQGDWLALAKNRTLRLVIGLTVAAVIGLVIVKGGTPR